MSYRLSFTRGDKKETMTAANVDDPTADLEVVVKTASFSLTGEVIRAIELAARRIQDSDHPIA